MCAHEGLNEGLDFGMGRLKGLPGSSRSFLQSLSVCTLPPCLQGVSTAIYRAGGTASSAPVGSQQDDFPLQTTSLLIKEALICLVLQSTCGILLMG